MKISRRTLKILGVLGIALSGLLVITAITVVAIYREECTSGRIPILVYHRVETRDQTSRYVASTDDFKSQLDLLESEGYTPITIEELLEIRADQISEPKNPIAITFDDGTIDHYTNVFPLLREYGWTGTFFISTKYIGRAGRLSTEQLLEMRTHGMSIQSHAHSHSFLDELDEYEVIYELSRSKEILESTILKPVQILALPGGWYTPDVLRIAEQCGYEAVCTSDIGTNSFRDNTYTLNRLEVRGTVTLSEFAELTSPGRITRERVKRWFKLAVHKILGTSHYSNVGKWLQGG